LFKNYPLFYTKKLTINPLFYTMNTKIILIFYTKYFYFLFPYLGKLRSLHQFIDRSPHNIGVRVYSGKFSVENYTTISGNKYKLINLPFYLVHKLPEYLEFA